MVAIHEKIVAQLEQRKLKKRDLARALSVSPQTATDICKGRSAITLPHLRNLVAYFGLRADFWLDEQKLLPDANDKVGAAPTSTAATTTGNGEELTRSGLTRIKDPVRFVQRVRAIVGDHKREFVTRNPDLHETERQLLGLPENGSAHSHT
jgi:plasmid maintenance system antidote protein VapI